MQLFHARAGLARMLEIKTQSDAVISGVACIESFPIAVPSLGLIIGKSVVDVRLGAGNGPIFEWAFKCEKNSSPLGIMIMETGEFAAIDDHGNGRSEYERLLLQLLNRRRQKDLISCFEEYAASPKLTDSLMIELLYLDILGRSPDDGGFRKYLADRSVGRHWNEIRRDLLGSREFRSRNLAVFDRLGRVFQTRLPFGQNWTSSNVSARAMLDLSELTVMSSEKMVAEIFLKLIHRLPSDTELPDLVEYVEAKRLSVVQVLSYICKKHGVDETEIIISGREAEQPTKVFVSGEIGEKQISALLSFSLGRLAQEDTIRDLLDDFNNEHTLEENINNAVSSIDNCLPKIEIVRLE